MKLTVFIHSGRNEKLARPHLLRLIGDSVADPGSGTFWPLDPGSGMEKNRIRDPGWTSQVIFLRAYWKNFWVTNTDFLSGSGSGIRHEKIRIRDVYPGSATLIGDIKVPGFAEFRQSPEMRSRRSRWTCTNVWSRKQNVSSKFANEEEWSPLPLLPPHSLGRLENYTKVRHYMTSNKLYMAGLHVLVSADVSTIVRGVWVTLKHV